MAESAEIAHCRGVRILPYPREIRGESSVISSISGCLAGRSAYAQRASASVSATLDTVRCVDGWMLAITIVGALAAIAAAYFAYPSWKASRAKPDLRLIVERGPATSAQFYLKLQNDGDGPAADWKLAITMQRGSRLYSVDLADWRDREVPDGWIATWMARGSDDSIGPGLYREGTMGPAQGAPCAIRATYSLKANGMEERQGRIEVKIGDMPDRPQTIIVT
jgi:hypothetical protein